MNTTFWAATSALKWVFVRLPLPFSATFGLISLWWAAHGFYYADTYVAAPLGHLASGVLQQTPEAVHSFLFETLHLQNLDHFIDALVTLACFVVGFVIAYNLCSPKLTKAVSGSGSITAGAK